MTNIPDAYLDENGELFSPYDDLPANGQLSPLTILASFDHCNRTADELCFDVGSEIAVQLARALFLAIGAPWRGFNLTAEFYVAADAAGIPLPSADGWIEDGDAAQFLYEWHDYDMCGAFSDAGGIVDDNGDTGMTTLYIPTPR